MDISRGWDQKGKEFSKIVDVDGHDVHLSYVLRGNNELLHFEVLDTAFRDEVIREYRSLMTRLMTERGYMGEEDV